MSPETTVAVLNVATFLIVAGILGKFAWPAIVKNLRDRENRIQEELDSARRAREEARRLEEEMKNRLARLEDVSRRKMEEVQQEIDRLRQEGQERAAAEAAQILERARGQLEAERKKLLQELRRHSAALAVACAERLLRERLKPAQRRFHTNRLLKRIGRISPSDLS